MRGATVHSIVLAGAMLAFVSACSTSSHLAQSPSQSRPHQHASSQSSGKSHPPSQAGISGTPAQPSAQSAAGASWRGQLTGYGSSSWQNSWGYVSQGSYGQAQLAGQSDPSAPGNGSVLRVTYGQGSSANSCGDCPNPGGGQFYTDFAQMGRSDLARASVLYLRYYVKFQQGFDFSRGGKLPGLYGGPVGQESGGHHGQAFSTRYMWRDHSVSGSLSNCTDAVPCGEVYLYSPQGSGYGANLGGAWNWQADGRWHAIEQEVNRNTGDITVWYDGARVLSAPGALGGVSGISFSGVFFSTFFGGHDSSWGPSKDEYAYFADFTVSTRYIGS
jgi:hypothetical protein